jgi:uncharacterized protein YjiS (DUF1127 family)
MHAASRGPGQGESRSKAPLLGAARAWFIARIAAPIEKYKARQTVRELSVLPDRELRDIGLLRADIPEVATAASRPDGPTASERAGNLRTRLTTR